MRYSDDFKEKAIKTVLENEGVKSKLEIAEEFEKMDSLKENDYNWEEDPNLSLEDKIAILEDSIDYNREEIKANRREAVFQKRLEVA